MKDLWCCSVYIFRTHNSKSSYSIVTSDDLQEMESSKSISAYNSKPVIQVIILRRYINDTALAIWWAVFLYRPKALGLS